MQLSLQVSCDELEDVSFHRKSQVLLQVVLALISIVESGLFGQIWMRRMSLRSKSNLLSLCSIISLSVLAPK